MDVVVTVPKVLWTYWLQEGDLAHHTWSGNYSFFKISRPPKITPGERVYIVAHGKLRGYAPLIRLSETDQTGEPGVCLVRGRGAVAVTVPGGAFPGFRGWRYRWWDRAQEVPFPDWTTP